MSVSTVDSEAKKLLEKVESYQAHRSLKLASTIFFSIALPILGFFIMNYYWNWRSERYEQSLSSLRNLKPTQSAIKERLSNVLAPVFPAYKAHLIKQEALFGEDWKKPEFREMAAIFGEDWKSPEFRAMAGIFGEDWKNPKFRTDIFPIYLNLYFIDFEPSASFSPKEIFAFLPSINNLQNSIALPPILDKNLNYDQITTLKTWIQSVVEKDHSDKRDVDKQNVIIRKLEEISGCGDSSKAQGFGAIVPQTYTMFQQHYEKYAHFEHKEELFNSCIFLAKFDDFDETLQLVSQCLEKNAGLFRENYTKWISMPQNERLSSTDFVKNLKKLFQIS